MPPVALQIHAGVTHASIAVRRVANPDPRTLEEWDRLVGASAGTDITQLSSWSVIRSEAGFSPLYLFAYHGQVLVGGCLVQRRRLLGILPVCYLPYGPVIDQSRADGPLIALALLGELTRLAAESAMTFVQPPRGAEYMTHQLLAAGFRLSDAGIAPAGSYRLDLTRPLEEIRGDFSRRLKSWTNRWESRGVTVRRGDDGDVSILWRLMAGTAARQGFAPPSLNQLRSFFREFSPHGHAALFIGEVDGHPVAADLVSMLGDTVQGRRCGFDSSGAAGRLSVPAAIRWEIIKWAKNEGYRWLDFGGLPQQMLDDMMDRGLRTSDEWPSAHCAKLSFNGVPFRYPAAVEFVQPAAIRWAYDGARGSTCGRRLIEDAKAALRLAR